MESRAICTVCQKGWTEDSFPEDSDIIAWANFEKDNIFEYGISGSFKLLSDRKFAEGDLLCNNCLKTFQHEPYLGVTCPVCQKSYQQYFTNMGFDCSADIMEDHIDCGYGSKYDSDRIAFVSERPAHLKLKTIICDFCIDKLIEAGVCQKPDWEEPSTTDIPLRAGNPPSQK